MNRNEIKEKLTQAVDQMDDKTLVTMAYLAGFLASNDGIADLIAETSKAIEHNEREAARSAYDRRQRLIRNASRLDRQTLNQIERAKKEDPRRSGL